MGDPDPPKKGHSLPIFSPCLLWPNSRPSQLLLSTCSKVESMVQSPRLAADVRCISLVHHTKQSERFQTILKSKIEWLNLVCTTVYIHCVETVQSLTPPDTPPACAYGELMKLCINMMMLMTFKWPRKLTYVWSFWILFDSWMNGAVSAEQMKVVFTRMTLASARINCRHVSICPSVTSQCSTETAKRKITQKCHMIAQGL